MLYYISVFAIGFAAPVLVFSITRHYYAMREVKRIRAQIAELKARGDRLMAEVEVNNEFLVMSGDPRSAEFARHIQAIIASGNYSEVNGVFNNSTNLDN